MRFLIIDDDAEYRAALRYHLEVEWPDAAVEEHRPGSAANLPDALDPARFDLVLLGHPLAGERGWRWLGALRARAACPPVIVFADSSDALTAVDALRAGAASFFPRSEVTHQRLIATVREETGAAGRPAGPLPGTSPADGDAAKYRVLETLHSNNRVSVYLAKRAADDRRLAFKVIHEVPDTGGERLFDRFLQEYEVIARVDHPNIVKIFDLGIADDHAYIAMEYLPGGRLSERLGGSLDVERVIDYTRQIAGALGAIHGAGILHRDLKPANIMFRDDTTLALIDFGLAKQMTLRAAITGTGQIFGTPYYMSPEQGHAEPADERSDIYSLGCIVYEMLTGQRPFTAPTAMGVIYKHAHAPRPRLGGGLELERFQPMLDRMLAARPAARYQSAAELLAELERL